jgi:hypothetical protein
MTIVSPAQQPLPSTAKLLKATAIAIAVAGVLLVTTVMPAEYGIDPTGVGARLGLTTLAAIDTDDSVAATPPPVPSNAELSADIQARNAGEAAKATQAFGVNDKQTFAAQTLSPIATDKPVRTDSMTVTLAPGKGTEVKMLLNAGEGVVYRWTADADVAIDMHGERPTVKGPWTSYSVEAAQRTAAGTFTAPFDGTHGWYWENRSTTPITVTVDVTGFQDALYQP